MMSLSLDSDDMEAQEVRQMSSVRTNKIHYEIFIGGKK